MTRLQAMLSVLLLLLATGCAGPGGPGVRRVAFPEIKPAPPGPVEAQPYRIRAGDVLSIQFIRNPELNQKLPVRADGKISLALVGEITAEGLTPEELRSAVSRSYKAFVKKTHYGEVFKAGDDLEIRFLYNPELNQALIIRSDGKISLPLIGDVQAAGISPPELRQRLIKAYAKDLKHPDIALLVGKNVTRKIFADPAFVEVALSKSFDRAVFVGGEVLTPKAVKFDGQRLTVLQAIMDAGGVKDTADLSRVVILRRGQFEHAEWIQTNLSDPLSGKSLKNDLALRVGDVVVVPKSGIAKVDLWVRQYIRDVLPLQSNFSVSAIIYDARPATHY